MITQPLQPMLYLKVDGQEVRTQDVNCMNNSPVAQSVERWTPYGGSIRPGFKSPGFEARRTPDVYRASCGYGCGWWRAVASRSQR